MCVCAGSSSLLRAHRQVFHLLFGARLFFGRSPYNPEKQPINTPQTANIYSYDVIDHEENAHSKKEKIHTSQCFSIIVDVHGGILFSVVLCARLGRCQPTEANTYGAGSAKEESTGAA